MHNLNSRGYALYEKLPAQKSDNRVTVPIGGVKKKGNFFPAGCVVEVAKVPGGRTYKCEIKPEGPCPHGPGMCEPIELNRDGRSTWDSGRDTGPSGDGPSGD